MTTAQPIRLNDITFDRAYQLRAAESFASIIDWAEAMKEGAVFPPIRLMRLPDGRLILVDGFHRTAAARRAGLAELPAFIEDGTATDAIFVAAGANTINGISLTNEDKRKAARAILVDPELYKLSDREIERRTKRGGARGLSHTFISQQRRELDAERAAAAAPGDAVTTDRAALRARLERHVAAGVTSIPGVGDPAAFLTVLDRAPDPRAYAWLAALDRFEATPNLEPPCPAPSPPADSPVTTSAAKAPAGPPATDAASGDSATAGGSRTSGGPPSSTIAAAVDGGTPYAAPAPIRDATSVSPSEAQLRDEAEHLLLTLERRGVEHFNRAGCQAQDVVSLWLEGLEQETAEDLLAVLPDLRAAVGPAVSAPEPEEDEDAMTARALDDWRGGVAVALGLPEHADLERVVADIARLRQERDRYAAELARRLQAHPPAVHDCTACSTPTDRMEDGETAYPLCWACAFQAREEMIAEFRAEGERHHAYVESTMREIADLKRRAEQVGDYAEAATQDALMSQLRTALGADKPDRWSLEGWQALLTRVELHATRWMDHVPPAVQHSLDAARDRVRRLEAELLGTPTGIARDLWPGQRAALSLNAMEPPCLPPPPAPAPPSTPSTASDAATPAPDSTRPKEIPAPAAVTTTPRKRKTTSTTAPTGATGAAPPPATATTTPAPSTSPSPGSPTPTPEAGPRSSASTATTEPRDPQVLPQAGDRIPSPDGDGTVRVIAVTPSERGWDVRVQDFSPLGRAEGSAYGIGIVEWWGRHPIAAGEIRLNRDGDRVLVWRQGALPDYAGRPVRTLEEVVDLLRVRRAPDPAPADPADPTEDPTAPEALCARIGALLARGETMLALEGRPSIHLQVIAFNVGALGPDARQELHEALAAMEATAPAPTPREPRWLASVRDRLGQESDEDTAWAAGPHVGPQDVARERERLGIPAYQPPPDPLALYRPWTRSADELAAHLTALPRAEWEVVWRAFGAPKGTRVVERVTVAIMAGSARSA